jgi:hypothetical protein
MKRAVVFTSLGILLACGPAAPPKQAASSDPPDPTEESSSGSAKSGSSSSGGSSSGKSSGGGGGDNGIIVPPPAGGGGKDPKGAKATPKGEAPTVSSLASFMEGLRWGMSHAEVQKMFTETGGVIWKDYDDKLAKARVGPEQTALEAERERTKQAFGRTFIEFKDTPTGFDATGIKGEYTYRNKESLMWVERQGKKRYFFFINDRLWKMYDEHPLGDSAPMGKSYIEAVNILNGKLGAQGRVQGPDAAKEIHATTVDWKDGSNHLRAIDRSGEHIVGIAIEDQNTLNGLASLRANKPVDVTAVDPSITAVTKGDNRSDPNAAASASGKKPATKPPQKK